MAQEQNGVITQTTFGAIEFVRMYTAEFQKEGTKTLEIKQVATTVSSYPSKRIDSSMQDNLFKTEDFGFERQEFSSDSIRMAWLNVPPSLTEEAAKLKLAGANKANARIYRVISNEPIIDENQQYAINNGINGITKDRYADAQAARYPDTEENILKGIAKKLILDVHGNVQYRRTFFWSTPKEDIDKRDPSKVYVSPNLAAELKAETVGASAAFADQAVN